MTTNTPLNWLDAQLGGYSIVANDYEALPKEPILNLIAGSGVEFTIADNPSNSSTDVTLTVTGAGLVTPVIRLTAPGTITCQGSEQAVCLDLTSAGFTQPMPVGCADGQVLAVQDLTASGAFLWGSKQAGVSVTGGAKIQNPLTLGLVTGSLLFDQINGIGYRFRYFLTENVWLLA